MSSRFVAAGTDAAPASNNDNWEKARQEVETQRNVKPVELGKQDGSLYDTLQANKAAKQEAFEESAKLRNQFRALDDSEIEFLDSVRESERVREDTVRQETAEQLELFRKQRIAAEQAVIDLDSKTTVSEQRSPKESWTTSKKRRRGQADEVALSSKSRKSSVGKQIEKPTANSLTTGDSKPLLGIEKSASSTTTAKVEGQIGTAGRTRLGLAAYSSDDD